MLVAKRNQNLMPSLFNELLDWNNWNNAFLSEGAATPKMNVLENDNEFELELCVPGLKKEDLCLSIDTDNNLVVEMVQKEKQEEKQDRHYLRREFTSMQFKQMIALPDNVKRDHISASVKHGILRIVLPKFTQEEKKQLAQTIQID